MSRKLLKSTAVVGSMTMISRLLGFTRDVVFANIFGVGAATDAFFVAFKIPNFLRRLFAEGAFSQAFVPILTEYRTQRDLAAVRLLIANTTGVLSAILLLLTILAIVGSDYLIMLFAPGFSDDQSKFALASDMLQLTFPYLFFISLTALAGGILNSYDKFAAPAITPVWLNLILIAAALGFTSQFEPPIVALAWGVLIAGMVQLLFQLPFLWQLGLLARPRWGWHDSGVRRILWLMLPAIFGSSVAQINLLIDTIIASFLVTGSVSWLYYSDRLVEFPLGIFGIALATVILPSLSQKHAEADLDSFSKTLDWGLRWVLIIGTPAAVGLILLAGPMLATLFNYGEFQANDVEMSALSLMAYGVGLLGFMLVKVLAPGFYARQDIKTPVRYGIYSMVANMGMNILFVVPLLIGGVVGAHAGLALATSLAAFLNAGLLFRYLHREGIYRAEAGWGMFVFRLLVANSVLAAIILWVNADLSLWLEWGMFERVTQLLLIIGGSVLAYLVTLFLVGIRPHTLLPQHR
ncbi:MAG TPA: murein biosynthesis integral membrane protein MurJ [Ectothiorhodospiraceae bacterium]|nr:murein biosynthesis integral membrane protein MurJ [Ectothiorhodospiraceae bacterium]